MAPPKGNRFHELANRALMAEKKRIFKTAKELIDAFEEYLDWTQQNPITTMQGKVKDNSNGEATEKISTAYQRPLSLFGFSCWIGVSRGWYTNFVRTLEEKEDERTEEENELLRVATVIRAFIEHDLFDGGTVGIYTPAIVMRTLGLKEATDITSNGGSIDAVPVTINIQRDPRCESPKG